MSQWPEERTAKRAALLSAVEDVADTLAAGAEEAEDLRTLPMTSVNALREAGLFAVKLPAVLGGAEADPVTQMEVFEALSRIDPTAGWVSFIGCGALTMCAYLPDAAIERMWSGGRIPTASGLVMPGRGKRADGGFRVNGRWSWASGVRHAEWVGVHVLIDGDGTDKPQSHFAMLPAAAIEIHDNWYVSGLKGTGSCDFTVHDQFVPEEMTFNMRNMRMRRGGPLYRIGLPGQVANELGGFAIGAARRALDEIGVQAVSKARGYGHKRSVADRPVFHRALGEADIKLRAARSLLFEVYENAWETVCRGDSIDAAGQVELRSVAAYAMHTALEVALDAFKYGGGTAARLDNMLQRCVRDLQVGAVHLFATDAIYEEAGRKLLGATDLNPLI
jgi:alkylation response protein AidB-like acyl-CoA dehydrogenase